MGTGSLRRHEHHGLAEIALLMVISVMVIAVAYLVGYALQVERIAVSSPAPDVARYHTLAGVAGVRALDRDISATLSTATLHTGLRGVAAVRALDASRASVRPAAGHLLGVADVRAVDRSLGLPESRLNLRGIAAVRAIDEMRNSPASRLNLNGVAAVRALDQ
jgi:hypothetical protein